METSTSDSKLNVIEGSKCNELTNLAMSSGGLYIVMNAGGMPWAVHMCVQVPFPLALLIIIHVKCIVLGVTSQHTCK